MSHKSRCLEGGCELQTKGCGALKHRHINTHMQDRDFHMHAYGLSKYRWPLFYTSVHVSKLRLRVTYFTKPAHLNVHAHRCETAHECSHMCMHILDSIHSMRSL